MSTRTKTRWSALGVVLVGCIALIFSLAWSPGYPGRISADAATGDDIGSNGAGTFTWSVARQKVIIQNDLASTAVLRVRFNATDASLTVWDVVLDEGDAVISPEALMIDQVSIYSDVAVTYGTDFSVKGWRRN